MRACSSNSRFNTKVRFVFVAPFSSRGQETIFLTYRYFLLKTMQIGKMDRLGKVPKFSERMSHAASVGTFRPRPCSLPRAAATLILF